MTRTQKVSKAKVPKEPGRGKHKTWSTLAQREHLHASLPKFRAAQEQDEMEDFWIEFYREWFDVHDKDCAPENMDSRKAVSYCFLKLRII